MDKLKIERRHQQDKENRGPIGSDHRSNSSSSQNPLKHNLVLGWKKVAQFVLNDSDLEVMMEVGTHMKTWIREHEDSA